MDVRAGGDYDCSLIFPAAPVNGRAVITLGGASAEVNIAAGAKSATIHLAGVAAGPSRVEAALTFAGKAPIGPYYVDVRRP